MTPERLPTGWRMVKFGDMAKHISERIDDPRRAGVDVYVGLEHLDSGSLRIKRYGKPDDVEATKLRVRPGQIIFGKRRAYQRKVAVANFDGICSAHAMVLEHNPEIVVDGFLPFLMSSDLFFERALSISEGSLSPTIKWKTLAEQRFPLAPKERQVEMVELFHGFEEAISTTEDSLTAAMTLRGALIYERLQPQAEWEMMPLHKVADVRLGRQLSPDKMSGQFSTPYLRAANVNTRTGKLDFEDVLEMDFTPDERSVYSLRTDDILLVEGGEARDVGAGAIYTNGIIDNMCFQNTLVRIRVLDKKRILPQFLLYTFAHLRSMGLFASIATGTKLQHIGSTRVAQIEIPLPALDIQEQTVSLLIAADQEVDAAANHLTESNRLKLHVLNALLSGEHDMQRLRGQAALPTKATQAVSAIATPAEEETSMTYAEQIEGLDSGADALGEYPIDSLHIRNEQRTIYDVLRRIKGNQYVLNPDFQRDFVWPQEKQVRLIESTLMRIPLPVFYLAERADGKVIVVDGLQRLTTFYRFFDNQFPLRNLHGANEELNNKYFKDLPPKLQTRFEDTNLVMYLIDAKVPERARLDIFERVNSGVPLSRQQMRNSLYMGQATRWLREQAQSEWFQRATGGSLNRDTMRDREAINRFCGFSLLGLESYRGDIDQFLADTLEHMNNMRPEALRDLTRSFETSMKNNYLVFERHAFRKHTHDNTSRSVINIALFDVFSVHMARYVEEWVRHHAEEIRAIFYELMGNQEFFASISLSTNDLIRVNTRFRLASEALRRLPYAG